MFSGSLHTAVQQQCSTERSSGDDVHAEHQNLDVCQHFRQSPKNTNALGKEDVCENWGCSGDWRTPREEHESMESYATTIVQ